MDNRRRRYWIDRAFQGRYLFQVLALEMAVAAVTTLLTLALALVLFARGFEAGVGWGWIVGGFLLWIVVAAAVIARMGVRISHRICGPVYRIRQDLAAIRAGGEIRPIRLRDGDAFAELADEINATLDQLKSQRVS